MNVFIQSQKSNWFTKKTNINFPLTSIQCFGVKTTVNTFKTKSKTNYT